MSKIPRGISGIKLAKLLKKYDYKITRQTGSHIRLTSCFKGKEHHITIPFHEELKIGTLNNILSNVAAYLELEKNEVVDELF